MGSPLVASASVAATLLLAAGCGAPATEVRWPASPEGVSMAGELSATARTQGGATPLAPTGLPLDGEDLPPDAPGIHARSFVFDGMWVAEVVLGDAPPDAELPLVVMFHGRGDRPRIPGGPFGRVPTPIRVLIPRGPLALGSGYAWARFSVTQNRHDELAADLVAIARRMARLIRHVERTRPTAGTPFVTGFSQGAMVSWTLSVRHPDVAGLVIPMAGWVPPAARPSPLPAQPPVRAMHGTADPIVRIDPTREWVQQQRDAGVDLTWLELEGVAHVVTPEMNAQFEAWLEEACHQRAPGLTGGLGEPGADPEPLEPYEPPIEVLEEEAVPAPLPEEAEEVSEEPVVPEDAASLDPEASPLEASEERGQPGDAPNDAAPHEEDPAHEEDEPIENEPAHEGEEDPVHETRARTTGHTQGAARRSPSRCLRRWRETRAGRPGWPGSTGAAARRSTRRRSRCGRGRGCIGSLGPATPRRAVDDRPATRRDRTRRRTAASRPRASYLRPAGLLGQSPPPSRRTEAP